MRRAPALVVLMAAPVIATAQVAPNRATAYLHPTDVRDARALWVNPAGLGVLREASVYAEVAVGDPGARGRLRQINAGFNARGLAFGYQRDIFDAGIRGHTYRLGLAGASAGLAAGFATAYYRGEGTKATGWDVGVSYEWRQGLALGTVITNIGQPVVRGLRQRLTFIPGATWHPSAIPTVGVSAHARITPDSVAAYAFGVSWQGGQRGGGSRWPVAIIARLDTDGGLRRGAFALGLSIGNRDRIGAVASTPGDVSTIDGVSLYGVSTREPVKRR
ncbi:MAG TPA: hypothetical protein VN908_03925 [Gemmatimonadales bacterium]|nr:hypothetical protein [Gemmatimonadales bacterium]